MFDIFEQPWTLLTTGVIVLLAVLTLRSIFPEKRRWWQLALPAFLAVAAFGLDFFVRTDLEKINAVINTGVKAVENENLDAIKPIISENYSDSYHKSKLALLAHAGAWLSKPLVEKNIKRIVQIDIPPPNTTATAVFTVRVVFDKQSSIYQSFTRIILTKLKINLQKEQDNIWRINQAELLEIDRQPVNWRQIR